MVQLVLGMSELPRPDDAADALAIATWVANTDRGADARHGRGRATGPRSRRSPAARPATSARSARPLGRASATPTSAAPRSVTPVIASVEGVVGAVAADSLVIEVGGLGYRVFAAPAVLASAQPGKVAQAPHVPPRPRGPAGAVRVPDRRGARLLQPAADGQRGRAEGRARDRRQPPDARPPARDHGPGPGGPGGDPGDRQEARRADHLRAQGEGDRGRRRRCRGRPCPGVAASEGEIVAALQALGYSLAEAREASRAALADVGVESTLEERVKAALRSLLRD